MVLNAGWNWLFFGLRSLRSAWPGIVLLDVSDAALIRRMARTDPGLRRRWCITPYGARSPRS
jgi:tryptophan-rich sensory protein